MNNSKQDFKKTIEFAQFSEISKNIDDWLDDTELCQSSNLKIIYMKRGIFRKPDFPANMSLDLFG